MSRNPQPEDSLNKKVAHILSSLSDADAAIIREALKKSSPNGLSPELNRAENERETACQKKFDAIFNNSVEGICLADLKTHTFSMFNHQLCEMLGYSADELGKLRIEDIHPKEHLPAIKEVFEKQVRRELKTAENMPILRKDGSLFYADISSARISLEGREYMLGFFRDISKRKCFEERLLRSNTLLSTFKDIASYKESDIQELCSYLLDSIVLIAQSAYGFFGFMSDDEETMTIHAWSGEAMTGCSVVDKPIHFSIPQAGIWAESIRHRHTVIINDYNAAHPAKKGLPEGHVSLENLMSVPIFSGDKIVGVAAVANRPGGFSEQLGEEILAFCTNIWSIVERREAEANTRKSLAETKRREKELAVLLSSAQSILEENINFELSARRIFDAGREMTGAKSGYVALLSDNGAENEVLFLESGGVPCTVDESLPMPIRGLRAEAYKTGKAVCHNDFMHSPWIAYMPEGHAVLHNVLFAPLNIEGKTVGIMGLANKEGDFTDDDLRISEALGQIAALALKVSREHEALLEERNFAEGILNTAQAIVLVLNPDGTIKKFNTFMKELSGYTLEEVIGKNWFTTFIPASLSTKIESLFHKAIDDTDVKGNVNSIVAKDGREIPIEWYSKTLKDPQGKTIGLLSVGVDISERQQLQKRLRQAEKMEAIGHLAGGIAHDFNNILAAVLGYSDMSLESSPPGSTLHNYLSQIIKATHRAKELVNQILSFSRQAADTMDPQHLWPIVKEVSKMLRASLPSTIEIKTTIGTDTAPVLVNATKIHEVIMNLCTNAAQAMGDKGTLEINYFEKHIPRDRLIPLGTLKAGQYSVISVKDTGPGITEDIMAHIFEPFFTTKSKSEGTGMGLAVVYGIVQSHGGNLEVRTELGTGTEFLVYLPKTKRAMKDEVNEQVHIRGGNERILFVDDEEMLCELIKSMLGSLGYHVSYYTSSLAALEAFKSNPQGFDLIITDQTMPVMTGIELSREVFKIRKKMPLVLCTGYSKSVDRDSCLEAGIAEFCMKPLQKRELAAIIRVVLDNR